MRLRIEYEYEEELKKILNDLEKLYFIKNISKKYLNRPPSKSVRVYVELEVLKNE
ncbi:hypothetical protein GKZ28_08520 [Clostridium chromiireducens]|uniref:DUF3970 domain-containing protein n=1 Tax=Clostridium chromiireducens TaxID=225345 RepID=A0A964RLD8_9CLOT|nr:hypothetical protein [Clostridium chromiireducens]MVX63738.1 hypothetical protein [Clostridium chromiireducens]